MTTSATTSTYGYMTRKEAAAEAGVSERTLRDWIARWGSHEKTKDGFIVRALRTGRVIHAASYLEWLQNKGPRHA